MDAQTRLDPPIVMRPEDTLEQLACHFGDDMSQLAGCMSLIGPVDTPLAVADGWVLAAQGNKQRFALFIYPDIGGDLMLSPMQPPTVGSGFEIAPSLPQFLISYRQYGILVCAPWYISVAPGGFDQNFHVLQVLMN